MDTSDSGIEKSFPLLKQDGYRVTSPPDVDYNCIGWAVGYNDKFFWPYPNYWPQNIPLNNHLSSFIKFFQSFDYQVCDSYTLERGYEKIAIYVTEKTDFVQHAARQLASGQWTSKLGKYKDIEHVLKGLTKSQYGEVAVVMRRKKATYKTA